MKKIKSILICILISIIAFSGVIVADASEVFPSETDAFGTNYYIEETNQDKPFFTEILPAIAENIEENNTHSISPYFDTLPLANNPENFQGLGHTSYANINGKTVTAEAFYRVKGDSLCDPNAGMGLLIYQCIQYKLAHPDEEVEMTFSTYRTSVTAAVCVLPESKYYGYMRSLYTTNYDEHGFVRISYMFTEAARLGIKVTLVNQLPSYAVKQYNPTTGKLESRKHINFNTYYTKALKTDCYNSFAPGKKVSDFMNYVKVDWTVDDQTANMQHVKSCTVSHYLATDGTEHTDGVFYTTANLDENDYLGRNGNSWSQTGVIISDHDEIYNATLNYTNLMVEYQGKEQIQEMRKLIVDRNEEQYALITSGRENEIDPAEKILYLGSDTDKVFQLYFTPIGGSVDTWDTTYNPICAQVDKLVESEDYIEFAWNEYGFEQNYLGLTIGEKLEKAFCENPNPNNKLSVKVYDLDIEEIKDLELGTEIGYRNIMDGNYMHAKDFLLSYKEDGVRHNVSILTSCNYIMLAFHYRTNSILVINETEETGGNFYGIIGEKYADGMIHTNPGDHTYESVVTKATTTRNGHVDYKCACGSTAESTVIYKPETYTLSATEIEYDGTVKTPDVTVKDREGNVLTEGEDYDVAYESGRKEIGTYMVMITFKGDYEGSKKLEFSIVEAKPTEPSEDDSKPSDPSEPSEDDSKPSDPSEPSEDDSKPSDPSEPSEDDSKPSDPSDPSEDDSKPSDPADPEVKYLVGDVNMDGKVNIKDATLVQKYAADLLELDEVPLKLADVNTDTRVNVKDATAIQKAIADIKTSFVIGDYIVF